MRPNTLQVGLHYIDSRAPSEDRSLCSSQQASRAFSPNLKSLPPPCGSRITKHLGRGMVQRVHGRRGHASTSCRAKQALLRGEESRHVALPSYASEAHLPRSCAHGRAATLGCALRQRVGLEVVFTSTGSASTPNRSSIAELQNVSPLASSRIVQQSVVAGVCYFKHASGHRHTVPGDSLPHGSSRC